MKKFILHTATLLFIALILIAAVILSANKIIRKKASYKIPVNIDKVILGHSHAECAFNDSLISDFGNFSNSGESYFYTFFKLSGLLKQNRHIKTVFIEFSNTQFNEDMDEWIWGKKYMNYRYKLYAPFMDIAANRLLAKHNPWDYLTGFSSVLQTSLNTIKAANYDYTKKTSGYLYLVKEYALQDDVYFNKRRNGAQIYFSETNMEYLAKIIDLCKQYNINIYLLRSPMHPHCPALKNEQFFQQTLKSTFAGTEFLDFKDFLLADKEFGDPEHLNFRGARQFSSFFNELLQEGLLNIAHKQTFIDAKMKLRISGNQ